MHTVDAIGKKLLQQTENRVNFIVDCVAKVLYRWICLDTSYLIARFTGWNFEHVEATREQ